MNRVNQISFSINAFYITLLVVAAALVVLAPKAAVNVDEQLHYPHAKKVVNWYFTGGKDKSCLNTPRTHLKYYGQSVDNLTALINRVFNIEDEFVVRHYTGAFFFFSLLLFSGLLVRRLAGSWSAASICILALIFMPRLSGQAFGNLKDIPFAAGYTAGIFFIIRFLEELPRPRWRTSLFTGIAIAFTVSVRSGGLILFVYLALFLILFFVLKPDYFKEIVTTKLFMIRLLSQGMLILITGYFAGLLFWPYALQNVFVNPVKSLHLMEHYTISIRQIFEGEMIWSNHLPWYYLPEWVLISTPLFILAGFICFLYFHIKNCLRKREFNSLFFEGIVLFAFLFPFLYVIAIDSNLYSGIRQMLFILPSLAVLAVCGVYSLIGFLASKSRMLASGFSVLFFILLLLPFRHQVATFPADYIYFNILAGGNKNAWSNYEYDYYYHGIKEPVDHVINIIGKKEVTLAMNCNLSDYFSSRPNIKYQYVRFPERSLTEWDYGLFGLNYIHPHLLKNDLWRSAGIIKTFYHRGNPIAIIVKRKDKSDIEGIREIKKGNLKKGTKLLQTALEKDSNNLWLYAYLANAKLSAGDIQGFYYYLNKGKELLPCYEPFLLFEAKYLYEKKKNKEALKLLNKIFEINPFYKPAKKLYKKVLTKLE